MFGDPSAREFQSLPGDELQTRNVELGPERSLHAVTGGSGTDIVLVHGALATHQDWLDGPFGALAELGRVTAVDRPGHGLSRRPRFEGDPALQAKQIHAGLQALGVHRAVLVGHSFAALASLAYAQLFPEAMGGLS